MRCDPSVLPGRRGRLLLGLVALVALCVPQGADAQTRFMYLNGQSIHPAFEGWWPNDDGSFTFWGLSGFPNAILGPFGVFRE